MHPASSGNEWHQANHDENIANMASSLSGAENYQSLRRRNWHTRERGGHIVHERSRRHEMSPEGAVNLDGRLIGCSQSAVTNPFARDDPQNSNSFGGGGASNDIPPEYANDPELWQAIQLSMMDSAPSGNAQND